MESPALKAIAAVPTATPSRHLQQLCKHFQHKLPVTHDARSGRIDFPLGVCTLAAGAETLELAVTAPDAAKLARLQDVIARHLLRFAFRDDLRVAWQPA